METPFWWFKMKKSCYKYKNMLKLLKFLLLFIAALVIASIFITVTKPIQEGLDSPRVENFDFKENLKKLKEEKVKNG